jgi:hypothetical protein
MLFGSDAPYTPALAGLALTGALEQTEQFTQLQKQMIFTRNAVSLFPRLKNILNADMTAPAEKGKSALAGSYIRRKLISKLYLILQKKQAGKGI